MKKSASTPFLFQPAIIEILPELSSPDLNINITDQSEKIDAEFEPFEIMDTFKCSKTGTC